MRGHHSLSSCILLLFTGLLLAGLATPSVVRAAQEQLLEAKTTVGTGWHPWYEVKADPEDLKNLIICGTKWDAASNSPFGFVYASADGGETWRTVFVDKSSSWVTEHSCAFGPNHRAFFISEASKVIDGKPHHELGTTRIFASADAGQHWVEAAKTGWADYSTSAVSTATGQLYTFFNSFDTTREPGRNWGSVVGLLVFSGEQKRARGPFLDPAMQRLNYRGVFPSDAVALRSGAVVALFYGRRRTVSGGQADIGVVRADPSPEPLLEQTIITHVVMDSGTGCDTLPDNSLAYDPAHDRLYLAYIDGCAHQDRIMLTSSDDEGKTWAKSVALRNARSEGRIIHNPSLVIGSSAELGLLWQERRGLGSGRWLFSSIRDFQLVEPPIELSHGLDERGVSNDALRTIVTPARDQPAGVGRISIDSTMTLGIRSELNVVWRSSPAIAMDDKIFAIWSSGDHEGMRLYSGILRAAAPGGKRRVVTENSEESDVTGDTLFLYGYGGAQNIDRGTGTLRVCGSLANRGNESLRLPIKLRVAEIGSDAGAISILNATNGLAGERAEWDIGESVTGDQVPPGSSTHPFCLLFHMENPSKGTQARGSADLLRLRLRVLASRDGSSLGGRQSNN